MPPGEVVSGDAGVVWARPGETIVTRLQPSAAAVASGLAPLRFGTSSTMAPLYWVAPERAEREERADSRAGTWMLGGTDGRIVWRARRADAVGRSEGAGFWAVAIEPPSDERPPRLLIDGQTVLVGWITGTSGKSAPWTSVPSSRTGSDAVLAESLAIVRRVPMERWRARLGAGEPLLMPSDAADGFNDRVLEALARQEEFRWQAALERIKAMDPALALRTARRLGAVAEIGGQMVPVWAGESGDARALRERILGARIGDAAVTTSARAWIEGQPISGAIIADDAGSGRRENGGGPAHPVVLAVNLGEDAVPVWVAREGAGTGEGSAQRVEAGRSALVALTGPAADTHREDTGSASKGRVPRASSAVSTLRVSIGSTNFERTALDQAISAAPPGVTIGPMLVDWTMPMFMASATEPTTRAPLPQVAIARAVAGRIYRETGGGAARWTVYVECLREAPVPGDRLTICFGPTEAPLSVLRVRPDGAITELRGGGAGSPAGAARVSTLEDRWVAWIPVPASAIEAGSLLRIGAMREADDGWRAAWPRPMLPWQEQPARLLIDLGGWSPVRE